PVSARISRPGSQAVRPAIRMGAPSLGDIYHGCFAPLEPVHSNQPSAGRIIRRASKGFQKGEPLRIVARRALLTGPRLYHGGLYPQNRRLACTDSFSKRWSTMGRVPGGTLYLIPSSRMVLILARMVSP